MNLIDLAHASIHGLSCGADGTWKVTLKTQELSPEAVAALSTALQDGKQVTTRVKPTMEESKSPAMRLKSVMYLIFKENKVEDSFDTYYSKEMEKIIEHYKEKLP